jgi:1-acyl-sn-glycerol-3-phosphate acyltransferase
MLKAHKDGWRKRSAIRKNGRNIQRYLAGVHVQGDLTALTKDNKPTLYFANHTSGWDGMLAGYLSHTYLHQDPFVMAAENAIGTKEIWDGTFSVNRNDHFSATKSLRYSVQLLQEVPRCALWIFPQGIILPFYKRPLSFQKGIAVIVSQVKEVRLVPVAFYYTVIMHRKPEAFVSFGEPIDVSAQKLGAEKTRCSVEAGNEALSHTENFDHRAKLARNIEKVQTHLSRMTNILETCLSEHLDTVGHDLNNGNTQSFQTLIYGSLTVRQHLAQLIKGRPLSPPLKNWDNPQKMLKGVSHDR